jgi:hypothetical protein
MCQNTTQYPDTDMGKFRQALHNAGFYADGKMTDEPHEENGRVLTLQKGKEIVKADFVKQRDLATYLFMEFGGRLTVFNSEDNKVTVYLAY